VGAWLAIRGAFSPVPIVIAAAVLCWVAGFDIIYACQDVDFDRRAGLHSIPARLGVARGLLVARAFHVLAVLLMAAVHPLADLHAAYLAGVAAIAGILAYEHALVGADDLSRVDAAFFTLNGWVSVLYLAVTLGAAFAR
jgi:4-hydroxybenzoate polyprenyltransferase